LICLIQAFLQFRRRLDKLQPFCRIADHTSEEVRDILATLEAVFQQLFPQLNLHQWAGTIYAWLTHPVLDPTHSGRVTMDNLMKLVTTALEWTYEAGGLCCKNDEAGEMDEERFPWFSYAATPNSLAISAT